MNLTESQAKRLKPLLTKLVNEVKMELKEENALPSKQVINKYHKLLEFLEYGGSAAYTLSGALNGNKYAGQKKDTITMGMITDKFDEIERLMHTLTFVDGLRT